MKFLKHAFLALTISILLLGNTVFAAETDYKSSNTILPSNDFVEDSTEQECIKSIKELGDDDLEEYMKNGGAEARDGIMGCAIKSGYIKFWMIPYFIKYMLEWVINLAGLISVLMILVGAYFYIWGGISDDKEKGKKVIMYAIGGLVLTTVAWFLVNVILLAITG